MAATGPMDWTTVVLPGLGPQTAALVTGGSGAIGGAVAAGLFALGARVGVMGRSRERVDQVVGELDGGDRVLGVVGDVAEERDAVAAVEAVTSAWGRLDLLVHCAAISDGKHPVTELDADVIDRVLAVNLRGALLMAKAAARPMRVAGRGCIVNVASLSAHRAMPGGSVYGASKAGLIHATRVMAAELGQDGIRVVSLSPGQTPSVLREVDEPPGAAPDTSKSAAGRTDRIPLRRRGELDDYVGPILFLASDLARYVTAVDLPVEGGAMAVR